MRRPGPVCAGPGAVKGRKARRPAPGAGGGPRTGEGQQRLLMVLWMEDFSAEVTVRLYRYFTLTHALT